MADRFEELRLREFARLDEARQAYLDYTGSSLYPQSLVKYPAEQAYDCFRAMTGDTFSTPQFDVCISNLPTGAVRASLGIATQQRDIAALLSFLSAYRDSSRASYAPALTK